MRTTSSTRRLVFPLLALLGGLTLLGCTTEQEARRQKAESLEREIQQGLRSNEWVSRMRAARMCGENKSVNCTETLALVARSETNISVRPVAIQALAQRCQEQERQVLTDLVRTWSPAEPEATYFLRCITEAISTCPSADAALALTKFDPPQAPDVWAKLKELGIPEPLPTATEERIEWLGRLIALPTPSTTVNSLLESARTAQARAAAEHAAQEAEAKRQQEAQARALEQAGQEAAELAQRMFDAGNVDEAWAAVTRAEGLGANVTDLKARVAEARVEQGKRHLAAAWKFVRANKPDEAEDERSRAAALGAQDDTLADAIAATPTARHRAREEEREARRRAEAEARDARQRAEAEAREARRREQEAEELKDPLTYIARGYGCQERILQGTIIAQVERGLYEFAYAGARVSLSGEQLPNHGLVRTRKTVFSSPGEFQLCVLKKMVTKRIKTTRGFEETWEVYTEDVRNEPSYYFEPNRQ